MDTRTNSKMPSKQPVKYEHDLPSIIMCFITCVYLIVSIVLWCIKVSTPRFDVINYVWVALNGGRPTQFMEENGLWNDDYSLSSEEIYGKYYKPDFVKVFTNVVVLGVFICITYNTGYIMKSKRWIIYLQFFILYIAIYPLESLTFKLHDKLYNAWEIVRQIQVQYSADKLRQIFEICPPTETSEERIECFNSQAVQEFEQQFDDELYLNITQMNYYYKYVTQYDKEYYVYNTIPFMYIVPCLICCYILVVHYNMKKNTTNEKEDISENNETDKKVVKTDVTVSIV